MSPSSKKIDDTNYKYQNKSTANLLKSDYLRLLGVIGKPCSVFVRLDRQMKE